MEICKTCNINYSPGEHNCSMHYLGIEGKCNCCKECKYLCDLEVTRYEDKYDEK